MTNQIRVKNENANQEIGVPGANSSLNCQKLREEEKYITPVEGPKKRVATSEDDGRFAVKSGIRCVPFRNISGLVSTVG
jgi:hypothetical protein